MEKSIVQQKFERKNFTSTPLARGVYENCEFINCDLLSSDLSHRIFSECSFIGCNLSLVTLGQTAMKDILFKECKMVGLHFENCNQFLFAVHFDHCQLDHSSFFKMKMKKTIFDNCSLKEVDFAEADLSQSNFQNCNLLGSVFDRTVLEKADFRTSFHYVIDPEKNWLKKARFSSPGLLGLLQKYDIVVN